LDLAEVRRHLPRSNAIGSDPNDIFCRFVRRSIERQGSFARQYSNFALLGREFPGQHVRDRAIECDADAFVVGDGLEPGGGVSSAAVSGGFDRLAAPPGCLADLYKMSLRYVLL
jgi:hypothetical protein